MAANSRNMAGTMRSTRMPSLTVDEILEMRAAVLWVDQANLDPEDAGPCASAWSDAEAAVFTDADWPCPPPTFNTPWDTVRLDPKPLAARLARANVSAGWVRAAHGIPLARDVTSDWSALAGLWHDLDAVEHLPIVALSWAMGTWLPGISGHQGLTDVLLDQADAAQARRRPKRPAVDRTDQAARDAALTRLFVDTYCLPRTRAQTSQARVAGAYDDWAADHWVVAGDREAIIAAVVQAGGYERAVQGRTATLAGLTLAPIPPGPRTQARRARREDLAQRLTRATPAWLAQDILRAAE